MQALEVFSDLIGGSSVLASLAWAWIILALLSITHAIVVDATWLVAHVWMYMIGKVNFAINEGQIDLAN